MINMNTVKQGAALSFAALTRSPVRALFLFVLAIGLLATVGGCGARSACPYARGALDVICGPDGDVTQPAPAPDDDVKMIVPIPPRGDSMLNDETQAAPDGPGAMVAPPGMGEAPRDVVHDHEHHRPCVVLRASGGGYAVAGWLVADGSRRTTFQIRTPGGRLQRLMPGDRVAMVERRENEGERAGGRAESGGADGDQKA